MFTTGRLIARRLQIQGITLLDIFAWSLHVSLVIILYLIVDTKLNQLNRSTIEGIAKIVELQGQETRAAERRANDASVALQAALSASLAKNDTIEARIDELATRVQQQVDRQTALSNQASRASLDAKAAGEKAAQAARIAHDATLRTRAKVESSVVTSDDKTKIVEKQKTLDNLAQQYKQDLKIVKKQLKQKRK